MENNKNITGLNWCLLDNQTLDIKETFLEYNDAANYQFNKNYLHSHFICRTSQIRSLKLHRKFSRTHINLNVLDLGVKNLVFTIFNDFHKKDFRKFKDWKTGFETVIYSFDRTHLTKLADCTKNFYL